MLGIKGKGNIELKLNKEQFIHIMMYYTDDENRKEYGIVFDLIENEILPSGTLGDIYNSYCVEDIEDLKEAYNFKEELREVKIKYQDDDITKKEIEEEAQENFIAKLESYDIHFIDGLYINTQF